MNKPLVGAPPPVAFLRPLALAAGERRRFHTWFSLEHGACVPGAQM